MPIFGGGQRVTGAKLNQMARQIDSLTVDVAALEAPDHCIATRVANQSIPTGAVTAISLDTLVQQSLAMITVPTAIITIPYAGLWDITAGSQWESAATGERLTMIYVNGGEQVGGAQTAPPFTTASAVRQNTRFLGVLAASDQVEMRVFHTSGVNRNFVGRLSVVYRGES